MFRTLRNFNYTTIIMVAFALTSIFPSSVSAITLTAAVGNGVWDSTAAIPATSPFESNRVESQPAATLSTCFSLRAPNPTRRYRNATASAFNAITITKTMTVTAIPPQNSAVSADGHITRLVALQDITHYISVIAVGLQDIISGQISESLANSAIRNDRTSGPPGTASATAVSTPPLADMAVMNLPGGTIIFLNNTSPNYILVDYANASVVVWTSPVNASDTASNTHFGKVFSKINAWLPYFEALGILALVYKVGKFIHDRVQKRRGRGDGAQGARRDATGPIIA